MRLFGEGRGSHTASGTSCVKLRSRWNATIAPPRHHSPRHTVASILKTEVPRQDVYHRCTAPLEFGSAGDDSMWATKWVRSGVELVLPSPQPNPDQ